MVAADQGGVGVSVVAAVLALFAARRRPTLLIDLGGDQPAVLGNTADPEAAEVGVVDWLAALDPCPDALARIEVPVAPNLSVLPLGRSRPTDAGPGAASGPNRHEVLAKSLAVDRRLIVIDGGVRGSEDENVSKLRAALDRPITSVLVTRACSLALRRPLESTPDHVVLIRERPRAIGPADVAAALGRSVSATVDLDPAVARAVDAGLLVKRLPRSLRPLETLVATMVGPPPDRDARPRRMVRCGEQAR